MGDSRALSDICRRIPVASEVLAVILVVRGMAVIGGHALDNAMVVRRFPSLGRRDLWGFGLRWIYLNRAQPEWIVKRPMATIRAADK